MNVPRCGVKKYHDPVKYQCVIFPVPSRAPGWRVPRILPRLYPLGVAYTNPGFPSEFADFDSKFSANDANSLLVTAVLILVIHRDPKNRGAKCCF